MVGRAIKLVLPKVQTCRGMNGEISPPGQEGYGVVEKASNSRYILKSTKPLLLPKHRNYFVKHPINIIPYIYSRYSQDINSHRLQFCITIHIALLRADIIV